MPTLDDRHLVPKALTDNALLLDSGQNIDLLRQVYHYLIRQFIESFAWYTACKNFFIQELSHAKPSTPTTAMTQEHRN